MTVGLLFFVLSTFAISLPAFGLSTRLFPRQPLAAALTFLLSMRVFVTAIVLGIGALGGLGPVSLIVGAVCLCVGGLGILKWTRKSVANEEALTSRDMSWKQTAQFSLWGGAIAALLLLTFLLVFLPFLWRMWGQYTEVHPLSWDVVSYHFPNVVDYMQTASLWTTRGPFSVYPGGNEALQLWSFVFLRSDALVGLNYAISVVGLFLVALLISRQTLPKLHPFGLLISTLVLWGAVLSLPAFRLRLLEVGRNDIELGLWLLAVLWSLQLYTNRPALKARMGWMVISGICLGMAVGIKPQAIYWIPGIVAIVAMPWFPAPERSRPIASKLRAVSLYGSIPAVLLGGFWYVRNLVQQGSLTGLEHLVARGIVTQYCLHAARSQPLSTHGVAICLAGHNSTVGYSSAGLDRRPIPVLCSRKTSCCIRPS